MNVLLLGDCASDGSNCLNKQIIGEDSLSTEYNLSWYKKYHKLITLWYLRETKSKRQRISDLNDIGDNALNYLHDKELEMSWAKNLDPKLQVTNLSKGGATAYGYYKRLLKYEETNNGTPDLILLTDYDPTHPWQRINLNGQKYFFEKGYDPRRPDFEINPKLKSPPMAQKIAFSKSKFYFDTESNEKRNFKIMSWFCRYLATNKYKFIKIKFYKGFVEFDQDPEVVDCSDLFKKYTVLPRGTNGSIKLKVQDAICKRVTGNSQATGNFHSVDIN
jgi:hypothetical protein